MSVATDTLPTVGHQLPVRVYPALTSADLVRYAGASGDFNPLHYDTAYAQMAGFSGVFTMGMLPASMLATYAAEWGGPRNVRAYSARFAQITSPGDELHCSGQVTDVSGRTVTLRLTCATATGTTAITATMELAWPEPTPEGALDES